MATATIQVAYEAETSSLKATVNEINQINDKVVQSAQKTAKESADAFKKMGNTMSAAFAGEFVKKGLKNINLESLQLLKVLPKVSNEILILAKTADDVAKLEDQLRELALAGKTNTKEFDNIAKAIGVYKSAITQADRAVEAYAKSTDAASSRIGILEDKLYDLAIAGQQDTQEFKDLIAETTKLKRAIFETDQQVDSFVEKGRGFNALIQNVQLVGVAFQAVEGISAAFGDENEELQKTLVKLNAVMAVTSALEQGRAILLEQQAKKTGIYALVQKAYNFVVEAGTLRLKLFRAALLGSGIGIAIFAISKLVESFAESSEKSKKAAEDAKALQDAYDTLASAGAEAQNKLANAQINLLVANNKLNQSAADNIIAFNERGAAIAKANDDLKKSETELYDKFQELQKQRVEDGTLSSQSLIDDQKNLNEQILSLNQISQTQIKTIELQAEIDRSKRAKETANTIENERLKIIQQGALRITAIEGESIKNKIALLKSTAAIERQEANASIKNETLKAATIARINAELSRDIQQLKLDEAKRLASIELTRLETLRAQGYTSIQNELALVDLRAEVAKKEAAASIKDKQELQVALDSIDANAIAEKKSITNAAIIAEKELGVQILQLRQAQGEVSLQLTEDIINADANARREALILNAKTDIEAQKKLKNDLALIDADTESRITKARADEANKRIDIANAEAEVAVILGKSTYEQRIKLIEDEGVKAKNALDIKLLGEEAYSAEVKKINAQTDAAITDENKKEIDKRIDAAFQYAQAVTSLFGQLNELSKIASEQRIADITLQSEKELEAINASTDLERDKERQRVALAKRTQQAISAEKTKQAKQDKALALFNIGISTAEGIVSALATKPPNPILAAFIAVTGALQLAAVAAKPIPKFERGGVVGGRLHSGGGTMVEAERDEYIVNRRQSMRHRSELDAINSSSDAFRKLIEQRYVRPALMDYVAGNRNKQGVTVNASLNSKSMEKKLDTINKSLKNRNVVVNINQQDSRYLWQ
jgi:hypothetical protein